MCPYLVEWMISSTFKYVKGDFGSGKVDSAGTDRISVGTFWRLVYMKIRAKILPTDRLGLRTYHVQITSVLSHKSKVFGGLYFET
jgi:hypothetical protein